MSIRYEAICFVDPDLADGDVGEEEEKGKTSSYAATRPFGYLIMTKWDRPGSGALFA